MSDLTGTGAVPPRGKLTVLPFKPEPPEPPQQFHRGNLVQIAADLGPAMAHFRADCEAIVIGSYTDQYGRPGRNSYTVYIKGSGEHSWYDACDLTLIKAGRSDLLEAWKTEDAADRAVRADLDWIFAHGEEVLNDADGASLSALAACLNIPTLWGSHGEGVDYFRNAMSLLTLAEPFLRSGDKAGWSALCASVLAEEPVTICNNRDHV